MATSKGRACVTGASTGIGAEFARRLAGDGYDIVAVARRREPLERIADELQSAHGVSVEIIPADLGDAGDLKTVSIRLATYDNLEILVNNAGFAEYKPLIETDPAVMEDMLAVNIVALAALTRAVLPGMVARNIGTIINVSSGLSFAPLATRATYSGAKAFVNNFTEAIAEELKGTGVRVQALCPGVTRTPFHDRSGTDLSKLPQQIIMDACDLVAASLIGLELGEIVCIPGLHDAELLQNHAAARKAIFGDLQHAETAARYHISPS